MPKDVIDIVDSNYFENNNFINTFSNLPEKFESSFTPGRKRLLERSKKNEIEWNFNQDVYDNSNLVKGTKVFHQQYGYGYIIAIEGDIASVKFINSFQKKIFTKYLTLAS